MIFNNGKKWQIRTQQSMKYYLSFLLMVIFQTAIAQQNYGGIKTQNGILLYFNLGGNSHTLNLEGDVDISNFPFIKQNKIWFQFYTADKLEFGKEPKSILNNYMNWEIKYHKNQIGKNLITESEILNRNGYIMNFWKFMHPIKNIESGRTPIIASYFLDFIHNDLIYRLSYASISGNDSEAKTILLNIADNFTFYEEDIDLNRLQKNIIKGQNYYDN